LIAIAGLHGNEPAGVVSVRRVCAELERERPPFAGDLIALAGNVAALHRGQRLVDHDLNRVWSSEHLETLQLRMKRGTVDTEDIEQLELLDAINEAVRCARGPVHFLDLHTSSSGSSPFSIVNDHASSRELARHLPIPTVDGFDRLLGPVLTSFLAARGHAAVALEAGQHSDPRSVDLAEAALWIALRSIGCVGNGAVPLQRVHNEELERDCQGLPRHLRVFHRHRIEQQDGFRMRPGYRSFCRVEAGEVLATTTHGEVRAPDHGWMLLPLYQPTGDDGFFLAREVGA
jgi:succinylglutamate desuccinylase